MLFLLQQYQEVILTLLKKLFKKNLSIFISIFYPSGEPRLLGGVGGVDLTGLGWVGISFILGQVIHTNINEQKFRFLSPSWALFCYDRKNPITEG